MNFNTYDYICAISRQSGFEHANAIEDYAVLIDEDAADECSEILDIIEAHFLNL